MAQRKPGSDDRPRRRPPDQIKPVAQANASPGNSRDLPLDLFEERDYHRAPDTTSVKRKDASHPLAQPWQKSWPDRFKTARRIMEKPIRHNKVPDLPVVTMKGADRLKGIKFARHIACREPRLTGRALQTPAGKKRSLSSRPSKMIRLYKPSQTLHHRFRYLFRITKQHHGVVTEEEFILDAGIA